MNNKARISEVLRRNAGATGLVARSDKTIFLPPITALIPHSLHPYTLLYIRTRHPYRETTCLRSSVTHHFVILSKCQMNHPTETFVGAKDGDDDFAGILGWFAKYIFTPNPIVSFPYALHAEQLVAHRVLTGENTPHYNSSKMNGSALLPESKRPYFFIAIPFSLHRESKQYCFTLQTILFDEPNTSVWRVKQYCLERQREVFRVNKAKMNGR